MTDKNQDVKNATNLVVADTKTTELAATKVQTKTVPSTIIVSKSPWGVLQEQLEIKNTLQQRVKKERTVAYNHWNDLRQGLNPSLQEFSDDMQTEGQKKFQMEHDTYTRLRTSTKSDGERITELETELKDLNKKLGKETKQLIKATAKLTNLRIVLDKVVSAATNKKRGELKQDISAARVKRVKLIKTTADEVFNARYNVIAKPLSAIFNPIVKLIKAVFSKLTSGFNKSAKKPEQTVATVNNDVVVTPVKTEAETNPVVAINDDTETKPVTNDNSTVKKLNSHKM